MNSPLKKALRLAALAVLLAIPLTLVLSRTAGGLLYDLVAVPLLYIAWMGRLYLRMVPRILLWGALLLFGLALVLARVLISGENPRRRDSGRRPGRGTPVLARGPVSRLADRIRSAGQSTYFRRELAQELARLLLQVLDHPGDRRWSEIQRCLNELDVPSPVRDFLDTGEQPVARRRRGGLIAWLTRWLRRDTGPDDPYTALEHTVRYLENRLEGS